MTKYEYKTIKENSHILEVKKSKFIAHGFCVNEALDCKRIISKIKKKYHDAKHNVYAFVLLDGTVRSSDDKEPSGTAGIQVLNAINNNNLKNTMIIVTRYFGGILLGTGGLVRAYQDSVKEILTTLPLKDPENIAELSFTVDVTRMHLLEELVRKYKGRIISRDFTGISCNFRFAVNADMASGLKKELELLH